MFSISFNILSNDNFFFFFFLHLSSATWLFTQKHVHSTTPDDVRSSDTPDINQILFKFLQFCVIIGWRLKPGILTQAGGD